MAWDDKPPTTAELKATAEPQAPVSATTSSPDWASKPPTDEELNKSSPTPFSKMGDSKVNELLKTGFNFDTFSKLSPDEKKQYEDLSSKHAEVFQNAAKLGASSGLTLGFNKELFNTPQDLQTAQSQLPPGQQALAGKESSAGQTAGNLVGGLPIALATGGATSLATKGISTTAGLGPLATRGVQATGNILSGAALGETAGIANSNAPTLAEKAKEALPSAALGAGFATGAEALSAAPQLAQAVTSKIQPAVQGQANKFAFNALKPTGSDIAKINATPGLKNQIGQYINNAVDSNGNPVMTALSSQQDLASGINSAKQAAGQQIGASTEALDEAAAQALTKPGADVPQINPSAMEDIKPNQPGDVESAGLDIQEKVPVSKQEAPTGNASETTTQAAPTAQSEAQPSIQPEATAQLDPAMEQTQQQVTQKIASSPDNVKQQVLQILSPSRMSDELKAQVLAPIEKAGDAAKVGPVIQEQLSKFGNLEDSSLGNLFKYRQQLDDAINFNRNPLTGQETPVSKALKTYRGAVDVKLMTAAKQVDQLTDAGAYDMLEQAKKQYSLASKASNIAGRSAAQQESAASKAALPVLGMTLGKGAAVAAGTGGAGIVPVAIGGAAALGVKKYGNQFAATSLNQLSQLLQSTPEVLGEFAAPLQTAAGRGTSALSAMNYSLYNSNEDYRKKIDQLQEAGEKQAGQQ